MRRAALFLPLALAACNPHDLGSVGVPPASPPVKTECPAALKALPYYTRQQRLEAADAIEKAPRAALSVMTIDWIAYRQIIKRECR